MYEKRSDVGRRLHDGVLFDPDTQNICDYGTGVGGAVTPAALSPVATPAAALDAANAALSALRTPTGSSVASPVVPLGTGGAGSQKAPPNASLTAAFQIAPIAAAAPTPLLPPATTSAPDAAPVASLAEPATPQQAPLGAVAGIFYRPPGPNAAVSAPNQTILSPPVVASPEIAAVSAPDAATVPPPSVATVQWDTTYTEKVGRINRLRQSIANAPTGLNPKGMAKLESAKNMLAQLELAAGIPTGQDAPTGQGAALAAGADPSPTVPAAGPTDSLPAAPPSTDSGDRVVASSAGLSTAAPIVPTVAHLPTAAAESAGLTLSPLESVTQVFYDSQLQSLWIIPTAAVS